MTVLTLPVYHIGGLALSLGKARMMAWRTIAEFVVAMPALFFGSMYFGIFGVIVARFLIMVIILVIGMEAARQLVACSFVSQVLALRRTVLALAVLAIVLFVLRPFVESDSQIVLALKLATVSIAGAVAYVATLYICWAVVGKPSGIERVVLEKGTAMLAKIKNKKFL